MSRLQIASTVLALLLLLLLLPFVAPGDRAPATVPEHGLPWQIETPGDGSSRVFGLRLGGPRPATLADARTLSREAPKLALLAPNDAPFALEAYLESVSIGPLTGRLVLALAVAQPDLQAMRDRAPKTDHLDSGLRKFQLNDADVLRAESLPLAGIVFIPSANLDEATILQRFGPPAERVRQGETLEHFLYPAQGLDVVLDSKGKEVLQYVAPSDFARLRAPLGK